jgi:hypothetical protein
MNLCESLESCSKKLNLFLSQNTYGNKCLNTSTNKSNKTDYSTITFSCAKCIIFEFNYHDACDIEKLWKELGNACHALKSYLVMVDSTINTAFVNKYLPDCEILFALPTVVGQSNNNQLFLS